MEIVPLPERMVTQFGSHHVLMTLAADVTGSARVAIRMARFASSGMLGRHMAPTWQVFTVLSGSGWVAGDDGERTSIGPGQAVIWGPGEQHESGADERMTALIVESAGRPAAGR